MIIMCNLQFLEVADLIVLFQGQLFVAYNSPTGFYSGNYGGTLDLYYTRIQAEINQVLNTIKVGGPNDTTGYSLYVATQGINYCFNNLRHISFTQILSWNQAFCKWIFRSMGWILWFL